MALLQVHHQFKDGHTNFVAQREVEGHSEVSKWVEELRERHPPPKDAVFMVCNEESEYFLWMRGTADSDVNLFFQEAKGEI